MPETPDKTTPAGLERKLASILSADVAGYSRLMADNEEQTLRIFSGHSEVFASLVGMYRGRIFNTAGDAILAEFPSAVDAVRCATEIQSALRTRNDQWQEDQQVRFRMGINLGDVMVHNADLLGDGVNVAARLQTAAEPGGICISGSVYDQIRNKLSLTFQSGGEQYFKNIPAPVRTFAIVSSEDHGPLPAPTPAGRGVRVLVAGSMLLVLLVAGAVWHYWPRRDVATSVRPAPAPTAPSIPAPASAAAASTTDGHYSGPICYGDTPQASGACFLGEGVVHQDVLSGEWTNPQSGARVILTGEANSQGDVQIEIRGESATGYRTFTVHMSGTLRAGRLDATGSFQNGRSAQLNWRRN